MGTNNYSISLATVHDATDIAYWMIKWDAELPNHLQQLKGNAQWASYAANLVITSDKFIIYVIRSGKEVVGGFCINKAQGIFSPQSYGQLLMWYVSPEHRGAQMLGAKLLMKALQAAKQAGLTRLECYPWADAGNAGSVLRRLGFHELVHVYGKELSG